MTVSFIRLYRYFLLEKELQKLIPGWHRLSSILIQFLRNVLPFLSENNWNFRMNMWFHISFSYTFFWCLPWMFDRFDKRDLLPLSISNSSTNSSNIFARYRQALSSINVNSFPTHAAYRLHSRKLHFGSQQILQR